MQKNRGNIALLSIIAGLGLCCGCRTNLYVNFGNSAGDMVIVRSVQTGNEINVKPNHFKNLSHSSGDIIVTKPDGKKMRFAEVNVAAFGMDARYYDIKDRAIATDRVGLNLLLQTNMQIYVLLPGQKIVDEKVEQPKGYPKSGQEVHPK